MNTLDNARPFIRAVHLAVVQVIATLEAVIGRCGTPEYIRSGNSPEFVGLGGLAA